MECSLFVLDQGTKDPYSPCIVPFLQVLVQVHLRPVVLLLFLFRVLSESSIEFKSQIPIHRVVIWVTT